MKKVIDFNEAISLLREDKIIYAVVDGSEEMVHLEDNKWVNATEFSLWIEPEYEYIDISKAIQLLKEDKNVEIIVGSDFWHSVRLEDIDKSWIWATFRVEKGSK